MHFAAQFVLLLRVTFGFQRELTEACSNLQLRIENKINCGWCSKLGGLKHSSEFKLT